MRLTILAAVLALLTQSASADDWMEYDYADLGFSVHFPAAPAMAEGTYTLGNGAKVPAQIYSVRNATGLFTATIADLSTTGLDADAGVSQAIAALKTQGAIVVDIAARVNTQHGRQVSIKGKDGGHSAAALFVVDNRLYLIEGTISPTNIDPGSGDAIRFQQSLHFIGANTGRRFGAGFGPNPRFRRRPGGQPPADQLQPAQPSPQPQPVNP